MREERKEKVSMSRQCFIIIPHYSPLIKLTQPSRPFMIIKSKPTCPEAFSHLMRERAIFFARSTKAD